MVRSREELAHDVVMLAQQQMSERAIARALNVGRNRVRKILRAHATARSGPVPPSALPPPPATRRARWSEPASLPCGSAGAAAIVVAINRVRCGHGAVAIVGGSTRTLV